MEALEKGLHGSSFTGFYHLCRALLVKSEADFDRFDRCFLQYFKDVPFEQEVSQELLDWLDRPDALMAGMTSSRPSSMSCCPTQRSKRCSESG